MVAMILITPSLPYCVGVIQQYSGVEAAFNLSVTDSRFEANTLHAENNFGSWVVVCLPMWCRTGAFCSFLLLMLRNECAVSGSSVGGAGLYSFAYASGGTPVLNATVSNSWFVSNVAHIPNNVAQAEGNFNGGVPYSYPVDLHFWDPWC